MRDWRIYASRPESAGHTFVSESVPHPSIIAIFSVFFRIGILSFGGGLSGWVYREIVVLRRWMGEDEFMSGLAMSQILPGTNITNLAIYVGQKMRGAPGAIAAIVGLLSGPFFAMIGLASVYGALKTLDFAQAAMDGLAAAAIGLLLIIIERGARRSARNPAALAALLATFICVGLLHWSLLLVTAVVGSLSVLAAWFRSSSDAG
jgi:chromate transporter